MKSGALVSPPNIYPPCCRLCFDAAQLPSCNNVNNISAISIALALGRVTCQQRVIWPIRSWYQNLVSWMGGIKTKSTDSPTFFFSPRPRLALCFACQLSFFSPRERFNDSLKIPEFTRSCMENHSSVTAWHWKSRVVILIQIILLLGGHCKCYFWDIWLKIYRLPINF